MSTPLRILLSDLLDDPATRADFDADPERFLADHGWDGLGGADVQAALGALTHELPLDQAARLAPLVAEEPSFDGDGLRAAIAGLRAATAAIDDPAVVDGEGTTALDDLTAGDPAAGIDALSDDGSAVPGDHDPADAEREAETDADEPSGIDELRFGEAAAPSPADPAISVASSPDEGTPDGSSGGIDGGEPTTVELFGPDPATSFDEEPPHDFYDPGEETSEQDGTDEPDDGFPY